LIEPYVKRAAGDEKAFQDDEFLLNDAWVRVDFMRRMGILYPEPNLSTWVHVMEYGVNDDALAGQGAP
jgi:hypothetical protein